MQKGCQEECGVEQHMKGMPLTQTLPGEQDIQMQDRLAPLPLALAHPSRNPQCDPHYPAPCRSLRAGKMNGGMVLHTFTCPAGIHMDGGTARAPFSVWPSSMECLPKARLLDKSDRAYPGGFLEWMKSELCSTHVPCDGQVPEQNHKYTTDHTQVHPSLLAKESQLCE